MDKWPAYARLSTVAPAGHLPTASQHPQTPSRGALSSPRGVAIAREMGGAVASDLTVPKTEADLACPHGVQFYDVVIEGVRHERAAWSYEAPRPSLQHVGGRFGFWNEIEVA